MHHARPSEGGSQLCVFMSCLAPDGARQWQSPIFYHICEDTQERRLQSGFKKVARMINECAQVEGRILRWTHAMEWVFYYDNFSEVPHPSFSLITPCATCRASDSAQTHPSHCPLLWQGRPSSEAGHTAGLVSPTPQLPSLAPGLKMGLRMPITISTARGEKDEAALDSRLSPH